MGGAGTVTCQHEQRPRPLIGRPTGLRLAVGEGHDIVSGASLYFCTSALLHSQHQSGVCMWRTGCVLHRISGKGAG